MSKKFVVCIDGLSQELESKFKEFLGGAGWWHWMDGVWIIDGTDELTVLEIRDYVVDLGKDTKTIVLEAPVQASLGPIADNLSSHQNGIENGWACWMDVFRAHDVAATRIPARMTWFLRTRQASAHGDRRIAAAGFRSPNVPAKAAWSLGRIQTAFRHVVGRTLTVLQQAFPVSRSGGGGGDPDVAGDPKGAHSAEMGAPRQKTEDVARLGTRKERVGGLSGRSGSKCRIPLHGGAGLGWPTWAMGRKSMSRRVQVFEGTMGDGHDHLAANPSSDKSRSGRPGKRCSSISRWPIAGRCPAKALTRWAGRVSVNWSKRPRQRWCRRRRRRACPRGMFSLRIAASRSERLLDVIVAAKTAMKDPGPLVKPAPLPCHAARLLEPQAAGHRGSCGSPV